MASFYIMLSTNNQPDSLAILDAIRAISSDTTAVLVPVGNNNWQGKKATEWLPAHINAAQNILDTTPPVTPQLEAQRQIDKFPIEYRALVLTLVDQINVLRVASGLQAVTPAQAINAIRDKAATL